MAKKTPFQWEEFPSSDGLFSLEENADVLPPLFPSWQVNFILFICIIRILVQKLHSPDVGHNETSQYS